MTEDDTFRILRRAPFHYVLDACILVSGGDEFMFLSTVSQNFSTLKPSEQWVENSNGWEFREFLDECLKLYKKKYPDYSLAGRKIY